MGAEGRKMADDTNHDGHLETIMNRLGDAVLALSDEDIRAEVSEAGANPDEETERTRTVLREALQKLENVNRRLSNLGHTVNSNSWQRGRSGYHNTCVTCGSFVSFTPATGEMRGEALDGPCPECNQYPIRRRGSSRQ
jgi:hypothetical protein